MKRRRIDPKNLRLPRHMTESMVGRLGKERRTVEVNYRTEDMKPSDVWSFEHIAEPVHYNRKHEAYMTFTGVGAPRVICAFPITDAIRYLYSKPPK